jgi:hypothetical protein
MNESRPAALSRVAAIATELENGNPEARWLVRELFGAFAEVMEHYRAPKAADSTPAPQPGAYLAFDPALGGWRVGKFRNERWSDLGTSAQLNPTHWLDLPETPVAKEQPFPGPVQARPGQNTAAVSLFITRAQKDALRDQGYDDSQIREMKPEEAHRLLKLSA